MTRHPHNSPLRDLRTRRGRLAKALANVNGSAIAVGKIELFQTLWEAGEDVDLERDSAADLIHTADTYLKTRKP